MVPWHAPIILYNHVGPQNTLLILQHPPVPSPLPMQQAPSVFLVVPQGLVAPPSFTPPPPSVVVIVASPSVSKASFPDIASTSSSSLPSPTYSASSQDKYPELRPPQLPNRPHLSPFQSHTLVPTLTVLPPYLSPDGNGAFYGTCVAAW